jgi:hypothetical protein
MHELFFTQGLVDAVLDPAGERPVTALNVAVSLFSAGLPVAPGFLV